jgi:hypothetical protein
MASEPEFERGRDEMRTKTEAKIPKSRPIDFSRALAWSLAVALMALGLGVSNAAADEPIVGLWQITVKDSSGSFFDSVFSGWTSDGLEFDQECCTDPDR